jgi:hypothetical protein
MNRSLLSLANLVLRLDHSLQQHPQLTSLVFGDAIVIDGISRLHFISYSRLHFI